MTTAELRILTEDHNVKPDETGPLGHSSVVMEQLYHQ